MSPLPLHIAAALLGSLGGNEPVEPAASVISTEWVEPAGLLSSLALSPATSFVPAADDDEGSPFSYTFLELGGYTQDLDGLSEDADNYQLKGSLALGMFQLVGSYTDMDVDFMSTDATLLTLGVGVHFNMTPKLDLEGDVSWLYNDTSSGIAALDDSGSGWAARFGPRWMLMDWDRGGLELNGELRYVDLDVGFGDTDGVVGYGIGARAHFLRLMSVGATYSALEDDEEIGINLRVSL